MLTFYIFFLCASKSLVFTFCFSVYLYIAYLESKYEPVNNEVLSAIFTLDCIIILLCVMILIYMIFGICNNKKVYKYNRRHFISLLVTILATALLSSYIELVAYKALHILDTINTHYTKIAMSILFVNELIALILSIYIYIKTTSIEHIPLIN